MDRPVLEEISTESVLAAFYAQEQQLAALQEQVSARDRELATLRDAGPAIGEAIADGSHEVKRWHTPDGWCIGRVHWSIVPGYDHAAACEGLSPQAVRQEIEIDWSASAGLRVYSEYGPIHLGSAELRFDPNRPLYCGWDFGAHAGGTPAWVPTQLNTFGQWLIFPPIAPLDDEPIGTYEFGQVVADHLQREYALPFGKTVKELKLLHFGDPNGNQRPAKTGERPEELASHFEILKNGMRIPIGPDDRGQMRYQKKPGFGFVIRGGPVEITPRLEAVRARLTMLLPGNLPALVVDPRATVIKDGFAGGYHKKRRSDGSYETKPEKNWYSHAFDALAYIAACLFRTFEEDDDEDTRPRSRFRCQAAGRMG